jgi:hypothetical protein
VAVDVRFLARTARDAPWAPIDDAARVSELRALLDNEPARLALALYALAWEVNPPAEAAELGGPTLFIGVEEGGNHAETGLTLGDRTYPRLPYLRLAGDRDTFRGTLLHESGHAIHALLVGDLATEEGAQGIAPIPHSTAAVTDRRTAFNEGWAIHLEAIHAHCSADPETRAFYDHAQPQLGPTGDRKSEYYFPAKDVMTYAQGFARYQNVRDGLYAFETSARGDYLRVQLDPSRDLRTLRDPGSLVANEGFVASVIFQTIASDGCDDLAARYRPVLAALRNAERTNPAVPLIALVENLGARARDAFLDLSRGVTVDADAAALWARLYDAAIALDLETRDALVKDLEARRARWRTLPLAARIGPIVPVQVPSLQVGVALFGPKLPMSFDANACGAPLLALIPGWTDEHVRAFLAERETAPYQDLADLKARLASKAPVDALEPL